MDNKKSRSLTLKHKSHKRFSCFYKQQSVRWREEVKERERDRGGERQREERQSEREKEREKARERA